MKINTIPNIIHFVFFGFTDFALIHNIAIKSAITVHKPDRVLLHYTKKPENNPLWDEIESLVELSYVEPPDEFRGIKLERYQYKADVVRLEQLLKYGGIYLDIDVVSLRPFDALLDNSCVMGIEACNDPDTVILDRARSVSNAVIMCEPNHPFIQDWLDQIAENLENKPWAYHAVCLPLDLLKTNKYNVHIEPKKSFMPFDFKDEFIFGNNQSDLNRLAESYTIHLWETIWLTQTKTISDESLRTQDNLLTQLIRKYMEQKKLKIAVYAISKNEEKFVKTFCDSAQGADCILIADTGSTDRTVELAREYGATVIPIYINPWRFDKARETALALLPADIDVCISLDLDEQMEPGWREEIERVWKDDTTRLRYKFDWGAGISFYYEKIHHRKGYYWHHPVHEYPVPDRRIHEVYAHTDMLLVSHHPDPEKSRGQYMPLLELAIAEDPRCPRNAFYHARELTFYSRWEEAITALKKYLDMPEATWQNERAYAMRLLGKTYGELQNYNESLAWYRRATAEAPDTREVWVELAMVCYRMHEWQECFAYAGRALAIKDKALVYTMDPEVWGSKPHDLYALAAYHLGLKDVAIEHGTIAVELSPEDQRLKDNLDFYKE